MVFSIVLLGAKRPEEPKKEQEPNVVCFPHIPCCYDMNTRTIYYCVV